MLRYRLRILPILILVFGLAAFLAMAVLSVYADEIIAWIETSRSR